MSPSILVVHPDRKTQRTVRRILGSAGHRVELADDLALVRDRIDEAPPTVVVVDGGALAVPGIAALLTEARARGTEACVAVLDADHQAQVPRILGLGAVTNLLVHPMPVLGEELTVTAQKLIRGDLFGAEKYLLWGTELHPTLLTHASQRPYIVGELGDQVRERGQSERIASMAMLVADELLSNAVHNAPVDDSGVHYRAEIARRADFELDGRHRVELRWGCDGRYLAVEVNDAFGSLPCETILDALAHCAVKEAGGGAGLGIALTYRSCDHLVFNLAPGRRTEAIALIDVRYPAGQRVPAASYNVFVERS